MTAVRRWSPGPCGSRGVGAEHTPGPAHVGRGGRIHRLPSVPGVRLGVNVSSSFSCLRQRKTSRGRSQALAAWGGLLCPEGARMLLLYPPPSTLSSVWRQPGFYATPVCQGNGPCLTQANCYNPIPVFPQSLLKTRVGQGTQL